MRAALTWRQGNRPLLILAGALAALAAILTFVQRPHRTGPPRETVNLVMVTAHPIAGGAILGPGDIGVRQISGALPPGALRSTDAALNHVASRDMHAGEILRGGDLGDATETGMAARVAKGERAFSMRVAEDEIVGGFLQSGDHVDVFATIPGSVFPDRGQQNHADRSQAVALLQNVLVLAVGETLATRGAVQSSARTVSLSLTPTALARLALAQRFGKIALAIRRPGDNAVIAPAHAALADLVPGLGDEQAPLATRQGHKDAIRFYSGTQTFWRRAP